MKQRVLWGMAVAILGIFIGCEELEQEIPKKEVTKEEDSRVSATAIKKYVIKEGEHHATLTFENNELESLKFKALFDSSAIYKTLEKENQEDLNKLYGLSDCNTYHQTNSARFAWRWQQEKLEIWAYTYLNGERQSDFIDTVSLDKFNEYEIAFRNQKYVFRLNDKTTEMPRSCAGKAKGYKLFPYFGGDEAAPNDISIWIEEFRD